MIISVRLDPATETALRRQILSRGVPLSEFVRDAIREKLAAADSPNTPYAIHPLARDRPTRLAPRVPCRAYPRPCLARGYARRSRPRGGAAATAHCRRHPEPATREPENAALGHLHGGERAALQLCARLQISLLLTDDLAAREAAARLGVTPVGSVGIVAKGHVSGLIDLTEAQTALGRLYDTSTLFVARALIDQAILALRRHGGPA